jgi:hypothetical protein
MDCSLSNPHRGGPGQAYIRFPVDKDAEPEFQGQQSPEAGGIIALLRLMFGKKAAYFIGPEQASFP